MSTQKETKLYPIQKRILNILFENIDKSSKILFIPRKMGLNTLKKYMKKCVYPNCKNIAEKRGSRNTEKGFAQFKWCKFHRKGKGKNERLELIT